MDNSLITNRQTMPRSILDLGNIDNASSDGAEDPTQFINLLQQKLSRESATDVFSNSNSDNEHLSDNKEQSVDESSSINTQVDDGEEQQKKDFIAVGSAEQEKTKSVLKQEKRESLSSSDLNSSFIQVRQATMASTFVSGSEEKKLYTNINENDTISELLGPKQMGSSTILVPNNTSPSEEETAFNIKAPPFFASINANKFVKKDNESIKIKPELSTENQLETNRLAETNLQVVNNEQSSFQSEIGNANLRNLDSIPTNTSELIKSSNVQEKLMPANTGEGQAINLVEKNKIDLMKRVNDSELTMKENIVPIIENKISVGEQSDFKVKISDLTPTIPSSTATTIVKTLLSGETKQVTVHLEPERLGKIEISLQSTSSEASLSFKLSSSHAKELISGISNQLEQVLNNQLTTDRMVTDDKVATYHTAINGTEGTQFSFGQHQFGQQNQNTPKTKFTNQYRNNKINQDEVSIKKQESQQQNEKNIISILV